MHSISSSDPGSIANASDSARSSDSTEWMPKAFSMTIDEIKHDIPIITTKQNNLVIVFIIHVALNLEFTIIDNIVS